MTHPRSRQAPPADDPTTRWDAIIRDPATPAEQARIATAVDRADAAVALIRNPPSGGRVIRGHGPVHEALIADDTWHRIAVLWHEILTDTHAFASLQPADATTCHIDATAIRAWLSSPSDQPDTTVADTLHIDHEFDVYGFDKHLHMSGLLEAAQIEGVFGVPGHTIGLLHLSGDHGYLDRHRITMEVPQHGVLCSRDLDTVELIADGASGVEAAVGMLTRAADITSILLHERALLAGPVAPPPTRAAEATSTPRTTRRVATTFTPLARGATTPPPGVGPPATPTDRPARKR